MYIIIYTAASLYKYSNRNHLLIVPILYYEYFAVLETVEALFVEKTKHKQQQLKPKQTYI